jgi:hypothetical protein
MGFVTSRDTSVGTATGLRARRQGFDSRQRQGNFLHATAFRSVLGSTQPLIQWVQRDLSPGIKRPGREAHHLRPCSAEVKNVGAILPRPHTLRAVVLN